MLVESEQLSLVVQHNSLVVSADDVQLKLQNLGVLGIVVGDCHLPHIGLLHVLQKGP